MFRAFKAIHGCASEIRPELCQNPRVRQKFVLQLLIERKALGIESIMEQDRPTQAPIMGLKTYGFKTMPWVGHRRLQSLKVTYTP